MIVRRYAPLYPVIGLLNAYAQAIYTPACNSSIYCTGDLLHRIQMSRIFPDSKTYVDLKMVYGVNETLENFRKLLDDTNQDPSREMLYRFVDKHFEDGNELQFWKPPDFDANPPFLSQISDPKLREFAKNVVGLWEKLGRIVDPDVLKNQSQHTFIYVPHGLIVPGGRFKELYYWDSFWIIRGLIISNMTETARGMIENLLYLVNKFGYVPNGSRTYYLGRSQPPLLAAMVAEYFKATGDIAWLEKHLSTVEKELLYWLEQKTIIVRVSDIDYKLLRYISDSSIEGPRPESYYEDYINARTLPTDESKVKFYNEMKSAAESGWDFSSRWFVMADNRSAGNLTDVHITRIVPVDLNAIFAGALQLAGNFHYTLKDRRGAEKWWNLAQYWRKAIDRVLWHPEDGIWHDYDALANRTRPHFYVSCVTPLWASAVDDHKIVNYTKSVVEYLKRTKALQLTGGVPASLLISGQQWDFPNAWPPYQSILINSLDKYGDEEAKELAKSQAKLWIQSNYIGFNLWKKMFEKYSAISPGHEGSGGEYRVQEGFGWTNGVALELINRYGSEIALDDLDLLSPDVRIVR